MSQGVKDYLRIINGDALPVLRTLPDNSVQACITSPPFWGLRDYGTATWDGGNPGCAHRLNDTSKKRGIARSTLEGGRQNTAAQLQGYKGYCRRCGARRIDLQIGLEQTPETYVERIVEVFREVRRLLKQDGTLWLNLGDCYATGAGCVGGHPGGGRQGEVWRGGYEKHGNMAPVGPLTQPNRLPVPGLKKKDLVGIPWRVAFALQTDGWWLRSDIIHEKTNPMPESVNDRPTRAHAYIFLLTKSARYYYDREAIAEPANYTQEGKCDNSGSGLFSEFNHAVNGSSTPDVKMPSGWHQSQRDPNTLWQRRKGTGHVKPHNGEALNATSHHGPSVTRNKRSVWRIANQPYKESHFATMPEDLVKPCVLAGSRPGDVILDPFGGSGTVGKVAIELGRKAILIELSSAYVELIKRRTMVTLGMI